MRNIKGKTRETKKREKEIESKADKEGYIKTKDGQDEKGKKFKISEIVQRIRLQRQKMNS